MQPTSKWRVLAKTIPGSRCCCNVQQYFTTVGKFKVKTPKYNCPVDLYSEAAMDEMVGGSAGLE